MKAVGSDQGGGYRQPTVKCCRVGGAAVAVELRRRVGRPDDAAVGSVAADDVVAGVDGDGGGGQRDGSEQLTETALVDTDFRMHLAEQRGSG